MPLPPDATLQLEQHLFAPLARQPSLAVYAVLDAARDRQIYREVLDSREDFCCLLRGQVPMDLEQSLPYAVRLRPGASLTRWLLASGFGQSWGVFAVAPMTLERLQAHLRQLLMVRTDDGGTLYFRFYDPRVLRVFLPTCDAGQLAEVFGRVRSLLVESEDGRAIIGFHLERGALREERIALPCA